MSKRFEYGFDALMCTRSIYDAKSGVEYEECELRDVVDIMNGQDQRIAELEELLKKSLESNNNFLKQIMELGAQLIKERLKGE